MEGWDAANHSLNSGDCASGHVDILTAWLAFVSQNSGECNPDYQGRECRASRRKAVDLQCIWGFHKEAAVSPRQPFFVGLGVTGWFCLRFRTAVNFLTSGKMRKQAWGKRGISLKTALFSHKATNSRCQFATQ